MWNVWGIREMHREFWWGSLRQRDHLEVVGEDGKIILKWIFNKNNEERDWTGLVQDMKRRRALVGAVMKTRVI